MVLLHSWKLVMRGWLWHNIDNLNSVANAENRDQYIEMKMEIKASTTIQPDLGPCLSSGHRRCADGRCIARVDLCPEEEMMNENTVLIMIVVGMAVVVFLIILYCFQQKSQRNRNNDAGAAQGRFQSVVGDGDNLSLNLPPPSYDEVINTDLYPRTPVLTRNARISSGEEPRTPPPNYDAALHILSQSQDSVFPHKDEPRSPVVRRSVSTEFGSTRDSRTSRSSETDYRRLFSNPEHR